MLRRPRFVVAFALGFLLAAVGALDAAGIIGFHYPRAIENDPLKAPLLVTKVSGDQLTLADGRVLTVYEIRNLEERIRESDYRIDLQQEDQETVVYVKRHGWICGTPWVRPIRFRLIPDDIEINRREMLTSVRATPSGS